VITGVVMVVLGLGIIVSARWWYDVAGPVNRRLLSNSVLGRWPRLAERAAVLHTRSTLVVGCAVGLGAIACGLLILVGVWRPH
jgi:sulfite exporter TauE/SafE